MQIHLTLNDELKRVAKEEDIPMVDLVIEVAHLTGCSVRQVYHYRSGKWGMPAPLIPILCRRFKSLALLHALADSCRETTIQVPEDYELTRLVSQTVRDVLKHFEHYLDAFDSNGIDTRELEQLIESGERVIQHVHQFKEIAIADHERLSKVRCDHK